VEDNKAMKIFVCVKHVPDTAAVIMVEGDAGYEDTDVKFIANPYDDFGVEEAVSLVEKLGGEVVIITVAQHSAVTTIRGALAMGADRAILVKTDSQFLDSQLTARALKEAIIQDGTADLVFTGKGSIDTEGFQTQYRLARLLGMPMVNDVSSLNIENKKVVAQRDAGAGEKQIVETTIPCVIGADKGLNVPRYPSFPNIMKAKKKEIKEIDLSDLGIDITQSKISIEKLEPVPERSGAKMLQGSVEEQVAELITILKETERVI
jgi:electron transfer flavoprotein beta subunit